MRIHVVFSCLLLLGLSQNAEAQLIDRDAFEYVDSIAGHLGPMRDSSLGAITREATAPCQDEICQIRGMYMWIVSNISCDCTPGAKPDQTNGSASFTFQRRTGTSAGFAALMSEMCRMAGIHCEMASGLVKTAGNQIANLDEQRDLGYWNIVRANGRWFVIDTYLGAGNCEGKTFIKEKSDAWFFTNRRLFSMSHFPLEKRMQLLDSPRSRSSFITGPVMGKVAAIMGILPMPDQRGVLRGHADSTVTLRFQMWPASMVERVISVGAFCNGSLRTADYETVEDTLIVHLPIPKAGVYELSLYVNGGAAWTFQAQAAPPLRRRRDPEKIMSN
jgi:hypothetical protein